MSSNDASSANAAPDTVNAAAVQGTNPIAKAAVDGTALPDEQLEDLASKLNIKQANSDDGSRSGTPLPADEVAEKKKKKSSSSKTKEKEKESKSSSSSGKVQNLAAFDPFADADEITNKEQLEKSTKAPEYVHIRIQQRNGRKTLTTVQGVPNEFDPKKLLKFFRKEFACNGTLVEDEDLGQVIQLQGDHRSAISTMLVEDVGLGKETIKIHGF